jgi:hypothetical protein
MATFTISDGRTITLRTMLVDDDVAIDRLRQHEDGGDDFSLIRGIRDLIDEATESASWTGGAGRLTRMQMFRLLRDWTQAADEDAVPLASEPDSAET